MKDKRFVDLYILGLGKVGWALIFELRERYQQHGTIFPLVLAGIGNSKKILFHDDSNGVALEWCLSGGIPNDHNDWGLSEYLEQEGGGRACGGKPTHLVFVEKILKDGEAMPHRRSIFVDCTASVEVAAEYPRLLQSGVDVVAANKKANTGSYALYQKIRESAKIGKAQFRYTTNVGGGLPIIPVIRRLQESGERIFEIRASLSGTLGFIMHQLATVKDMTWNKAIREAMRLGYTERDPREDLGGMDVARKLLVLAREIGLSLELADIEVANLVPEEARSTKSIDEAINAFDDYEDAWIRMVQTAKRRGERYGYIAELYRDERGKIVAKVGLELLTEGDVGYGSEGDNVIALTSRRYADRPLIIQGPGAGPEVTAGGLLADILDIAKTTESC